MTVHHSKPDTRETFEFAGKEVKLDTSKKLTFICHSTPYNITPKARMSISATETVYHAERVVKLHKRTAELVKLVLKKDYNKEFTDTYKKAGWSTTIKHLVGLMDLTLKFIDMKVPWMWSLPETHLHPKYQANLTDAILEIQKTMDIAGD